MGVSVSKKLSRIDWISEWRTMVRCFVWDMPKTSKDYGSRHWYEYFKELFELIADHKCPVKYCGEYGVVSRVRIAKLAGKYTYAVCVFEKDRGQSEPISIFNDPYPTEREALEAGVAKVLRITEDKKTVKWAKSLLEVKGEQMALF